MMRQRFAGVLFVARRGRNPDPQIAPQVPSEEEQAKMLQPEDCGRTIAFVASMPPRVCINEILISPTHNRLIQMPHNREAAPAQKAS